jgi:excinuclease ABC subunit C
VSKIQEKLIITPNVSGVYLMRDCHKHIIYIGKAKDLRKRLSSYFVSKVHDAKVTAMLANVDDYEYFVTRNEKDALGLEANLIKKHKPHYNILLKDNKTFPYILIDGGKIEITRKTNRKGKYFGPYFNGIWAKGLLDTVYDIFGVRGNADGETLEKIKQFLRGENDFGAREILTGKMEQASAMNQFELAIRYRDGLQFLDKLKERTITQVGRDLNCDVFGSFAGGDVFVVSVLTVRAGKLIGVQNFTNIGAIGDVHDFIAQYYLDSPRPDEVITAAERGHKKHLLDMADANAKEYIETSIERIEFKNQFTVGACQELARELNLACVPKKIECFDISNLYGEESVASMVTFIDGRAEKKLYRKFKIRSHGGIDDYKSLREVLKRRMARTDWEYPDLIIIDGGKGQLSAVSDTVTLPVIAFSENDEIFTPELVSLSKRSYALRLLQRIRDEAHRFAVTYHKKRRDMKNRR